MYETIKDLFLFVRKLTYKYIFDTDKTELDKKKNLRYK